jgi:hypothetical protein
VTHRPVDVDAYMRRARGSGADVPVLGGRASRLMSWAELEELPEPRWLVEGALPEVGVAQIFGPPAGGKTFVALDLALRVTNGVPDWHGHEVHRSGPAVYALMEGLHDWRRRVEAWTSANGGSAAGLYTLPEQPVDLADASSIALLGDDVTSLRLAPSLLVIDTQALATPGTDENSNSDMGAVMSRLKALARGLGCLVITVHHTGHEGTRERGASAQRAALDVQMRVLDGELSFTKAKYAARPAPSRFALEPAGRSVWARPVLASEAAAGATAAATARILAAVDADPGIAFSGLYAEVRGDKGTFRRALERLVAEQGVHEARSGRARRFFPRDDEP